MVINLVMGKTNPDPHDLPFEMFLSPETLLSLLPSSLPLLYLSISISLSLSLSLSVTLLPAGCYQNPTLAANTLTLAAIRTTW